MRMPWASSGPFNGYTIPALATGAGQEAQRLGVYLVLCLTIVGTVSTAAIVAFIPVPPPPVESFTLNLGTPENIGGWHRVRVASASALRPLGDFEAELRTDRGFEEGMDPLRLYSTGAIRFTDLNGDLRVSSNDYFELQHRCLGTAERYTFTLRLQDGTVLDTATFNAFC